MCAGAGVLIPANARPLIPATRCNVSSMLGLLIIVGIAIVIGIPLWAIIDAAQRPAQSFQRIGSNKSRWMLLLVVLTVFVNLAGVVASIVYLTSARPRLRSLGADTAVDMRDPPLADRNPELLASDADREGVSGQLQRNYEAGRLSLEEFHERVDHALRAHTVGDLGVLIRDLPPE
jgi:hypothetical protein